MALASTVIFGSESGGTGDHILLSDSMRLSFSSPPTIRRVKVEVFEAAHLKTQFLPHREHSVSITTPARDITNAHCKNDIKYICKYIVWGKLQFLFNVEPGGSYSYHCALKG
jgi:hypothetical protein